MNFFESKKAILEYCGKDSKDVRWLDRAIKDGRIGICEGAYYVVKEYIADLEKENGDLEEEVVRLRKENKSESKQSEATTQTTTQVQAEDIDKYKRAIKKQMDENKELRQHLMLIWSINEGKNIFMKTLGDAYFAKHSHEMDYEDAISDLYKKYGYSPDLSEVDERRWAVDNGIILS